MSPARSTPWSRPPASDDGNALHATSCHPSLAWSHDTDSESKTTALLALMTACLPAVAGHAAPQLYGLPWGPVGDRRPWQRRRALRRDTELSGPALRPMLRTTSPCSSGFLHQAARGPPQIHRRNRVSTRRIAWRRRGELRRIALALFSEPPTRDECCNPCTVTPAAGNGQLHSPCRSRRRAVHDVDAVQRRLETFCDVGRQLSVPHGAVAVSTWQRCTVDACPPVAASARGRAARTPCGRARRSAVCHRRQLDGLGACFRAAVTHRHGKSCTADNASR
jgi:hypothetical protein